MPKILIKNQFEIVNTYSFFISNLGHHVSKVMSFTNATVDTDPDFHWAIPLMFNVTFILEPSSPSRGKIYSNKLKSRCVGIHVGAITSSVGAVIINPKSLSNVVKDELFISTLKTCLKLDDLLKGTPIETILTAQKNGENNNESLCNKRGFETLIPMGLRNF